MEAELQPESVKAASVTLAVEVVKLLLASRSCTCGCVEIFVPAVADELG